MSFKAELGFSEVKPLFKYINEIITCKCFPDMILQKLFPDAKEITESSAAYNVVRNKVRMFNLGDPEVTMIAVGDGNTPRTAGLFAYRTAWKCISVDPRLKKPHWPIYRLTCLPDRVEDFNKRHYKKLVIAAVHSHARLDIVADKFTADERLIIAIPCCVPQELKRKPDIEYIDKGIWSPCNKVKIWIERKGNDTGNN